MVTMARNIVLKSIFDMVLFVRFFQRPFFTRSSLGFFHQQRSKLRISFQLTFHRVGILRVALPALYGMEWIVVDSGFFGAAVDAMG
jgi:hypothetical protein